MTLLVNDRKSALGKIKLHVPPNQVLRKIKYCARCEKREQCFSGVISFHFIWRIWFISNCVCVWIGTLAGPVTFPLRGTLAINFIHVGGEAGNNCSNVEIVFPIKGKSESCLSLNTSIIRLLNNDFLKARATRWLKERPCSLVLMTVYILD